MRLILIYLFVMIGVGGYAQTTHKNYPVADKPILAKAVEKKTTTHKKAPSKKAVASKKSSKKKSPTPKVQKPCINEFYAGYCLKPDSAVSPYLYYQVYDWLGTRYKYSGSSKNGIDCSGFVCEMYRNAYCVTLNGSSGSIYTQVKPVEKTELKEGDILFFKIRKKQISHVGVYLGNNKFAHASVHSGVIVSDLNEEYYKKYFFKGGRFLME